MQSLTRFSSLLRFCFILLLGGAGLTVFAATSPAAGSPAVGVERLLVLSQLPARAAALSSSLGLAAIVIDTAESP